MVHVVCDEVEGRLGFGRGRLGIRRGLSTSPPDLESSFVTVDSLDNADMDQDGSLKRFIAKGFTV